MRQLSTLSGGLLLALGLSGCGTDCGLEPEPCESRQLTISSLEAEYGCTNTRYLNTEPTGAALIVRTQAEFDQRVSGACHPQIDFTKYDLVVGQQQQLGGAASSSVTYDYQLACPANERVLRVVLKMGVTNDLGSRSYHALVPKLAPTETVRVIVEVTQ
ncbi:hypothetical protein [Hymenobacter rubripertinctus]|uniref:Lipoprotein n=1 Tax=Hymenobacter rubripertinctus TaxID=2029981 RepID=A0A418QSK8_9BACT|nr:hypothetical protein [Hymenobacter rubripertinctus]RIY08257.1 hypothetical protein D0T11_14535 [Hymenobacter rubripertinctus]